MKKLKTILSLNLMTVLIFSTLGFSVSRHYCMGMLVEESFYHFADCGDLKDDHCEDDAAHISKDCCQDENLLVAGIDITNIVQEKSALDFDFSAFQLPIVSHLFRLSIPKELDHSPVHNTSPPPFQSGRQILVEVQRFLI